MVFLALLGVLGAEFALSGAGHTVVRLLDARRVTALLAMDVDHALLASRTQPSCCRPRQSSATWDSLGAGIPVSFSVQRLRPLAAEVQRSKIGQGNEGQS